MSASFKGNPNTRIVSCYSPTSAGDESDITTFYDRLSSLVRHIPNYNVRIICEDMNAKIDKE